MAAHVRFILSPCAAQYADSSRVIYIKIYELEASQTQYGWIELELGAALIQSVWSMHVAHAASSCMIPHPWDKAYSG